MALQSCATGRCNQADQTEPSSKPAARPPPNLPTSTRPGSGSSQPAPATSSWSTPSDGTRGSAASPPSPRATSSSSATGRSLPSPPTQWRSTQTTRRRHHSAPRTSCGTDFGCFGPPPTPPHRGSARTHSSPLFAWKYLHHGLAYDGGRCCGTSRMDEVWRRAERHEGTTQRHRPCR